MVHAVGRALLADECESTPIWTAIASRGGPKRPFAGSPHRIRRLRLRTASIAIRSEGMTRRTKLSSIAAAGLFAAACSATDPLAAAAQAPPSASAPVPQAGSFLLTVFLRHD